MAEGSVLNWEFVIRAALILWIIWMIVKYKENKKDSFKRQSLSKGR